MRDHRYWSVDSNPERLTCPVPSLAGPWVLGVFVLVSVWLTWLVNRTPALAELFPNHDIVFSPYAGTHSLPLRIFILSFFAAYASGVRATLRVRIWLFFELTIYFVLLCAATDLINIVLQRAFGLVYSIHVIEIFSGLAGFLVFSIRLLDCGAMPPRAATPYRSGFKPISAILLFMVVIAAIFISIAVDRLDLLAINDLRKVALLGGTGPGVFLFLPTLFFMLYVLGTIRAIGRRRTAYAPPVTVIIPAHNEAHVIARTLGAIDVSAARYGGSVRVLVLNNCSEDDTRARAQAALDAAAHVDGDVVDVTTPGKAIALNHGIALTQTPYLIRIDADTQIRPHTIRRTMRLFARPDVGAVGGMPLAPGGGPFDRPRTLEVLLKHGYYQVAYCAIDAIVGIPGMFAAYRTDALREVGGFVQGMNGEDTDASLRIGEAGYRLLGDPSITYVSEVPNTWRHLREQRLRWFRSVYHVTARNRNYLDSWVFSVRGKVVLPFMLINSARRAMGLPLVIFSFVNYAFSLNEQSSLSAQMIIALILGAPILMAIFAALVNGNFRALLGLPEYFLFRIVRNYLTLESMLSINFARRVPAGNRRNAPPPVSEPGMAR
ncbi:glycosyltransferase [Pelagibacterium halotolerans]|uniref:glycosyltransferase n=1 Tax=Pelagibacterium halotolerans TaxID=531813 RepID=UPI003850E798